MALHEKTLLRKLAEINKNIEEKYYEEIDLGLFSGLSGVILFQFYYANFLNDKKNYDAGIKTIEKSIKMINNGYNRFTYCNGLAGLGWSLNHIESLNFIDVDCDNLLISVDDVLYKIMIEDSKKGNFDFLHGALGYAYYFLARYSCTKNLQNKYRNYLINFLELLIEKAEYNPIKNEIKWKSKIPDVKENNGYNFGLSHGIPSIIAFLTKLVKFDDFKNYKWIISSSINFIFKYKKMQDLNTSYFPSYINERGKIVDLNRVAWCYGDLGLGLTLFNASKILCNKELELQTLEILNNVALRRSRITSSVTDPSICHGAFGNATLFKELYRKTSKTKFLETSEFWISKGLEMSVFKDNSTGFKTWNHSKQNWEFNLSLLAGISGIGLSIISFLDSTQFKWNQCLLV
ncbi:MAG: hypothetical protein HRT67_03460 [Flavobacteriaceae bacterium]|nr:hypothetical protein [Flavobacteriaceae bacterium]